MEPNESPGGWVNDWDLISDKTHKGNCGGKPMKIRLARWLRRLIGIKHKPREPLVSLIIPRHFVEASYYWDGKGPWDEEIAAGRMEYDPETEVMTLLEASDQPTNAIDERTRKIREDSHEELLRKQREIEIRVKHPKLPSNLK